MVHERKLKLEQQPTIQLMEEHETALSLVFSSLNGLVRQLSNYSQLSTRQYDEYVVQVDLDQQIKAFEEHRASFG